MTNNTSQPLGLHRIKFHGKGGEYFAIWLVNALLTALTLGIYSAWATVRRRRYFYGNTELDGDRFDYHAQPLQILKGRLLVIGGIIVFYFLLAVTPLLGLLALLVLLALLPWIVIRSWRYNAIMSSYRGVRFNYVCRTGRAYWALLFCPLLLIIGLYVGLIVLLGIGSGLGSINAIAFMLVLTLILAVPAFAAVNGIISALQHDLYVNNLFFGNTPFIAGLKKSAFIKFALIGLLIFLPFMLVALVCIGSFFFTLYQMVLMGMLTNEAIDVLVLDNISSLLLMMVVLLIGALVASSYQVVAQRNYLFNQARLNGDIKLHSSMKTLPYMGLLITNTLITLFSLGLAAPVAEVRHARYLAECTAVEGDLALLDIAAHQETANSAVAEEAVQALDLGGSF
ncbi:YjgN family protein [Serratia ureilytica]|uniref:YjgN family protein n=1 Tax=Serratia ureilytica TaxID=300181 RepID=UPI00313D32CC